MTESSASPIGPTKIPTRPARQPAAQRQPRRTLALDTDLYHERNQAERCFNRLKQFRAIATRHDKLASLILWTHEQSDGPRAARALPADARSHRRSHRPAR